MQTSHSAVIYTVVCRFKRVERGESCHYPSEEGIKIVTNSNKNYNPSFELLVRVRNEGGRWQQQQAPAGG